MFSSQISFLLQFSALLVAAQGRSNNTPGIQWGPCSNDYNSILPADCGTLLVPLDYTDLYSTEKYALDLLRIPATEQPAKGSIVFNFGGPGEIGRSTLADVGTVLQALTGGEYNLISFDPRGTSTSNMPITCFDNEFDLKTSADAQVIPDLHDEATLRKLWLRGGLDATACAEKHKKNGTLVGTAFTARDVMSITEAVNDDGMLRYWGYSYGTTLGATLVSMFPDKVEKVILDGVQNPYQYYHAYADAEEWSQSDEVFAGIFSSCVASPDQCTLARDNQTAAELEQSVMDLIEHLKYHPIGVGQLIVDNSIVYQLVQNSLYSISSWQNTTKALDMLINGNIDETFILYMASQFHPINEQTLAGFSSVYFALEAIHCSDRAARAGTYENFVPTMNELYETSKIMGRDDISISMACAQWQLEPKERYEGDFQVTPKNPVLFIGNSYDAHTPIRSARNVSSGFEGSVVLEVNGYGHSSLGLPSVCTMQTTASYWVNGTIPEPDTICQVEARPFANISWADVIEMASKN